MNLTPDERLVDALTTVIYQYPPMVREMINLSTGEEERRRGLLRLLRRTPLIDFLKKGLDTPDILCYYTQADVWGVTLNLRV